MTSTRLRRALGLPLLVFYGLGVTIGAGIFALIGEIVRLAGDHAPLSFLLAGLVAAGTGWSYAVLVRVYPRAAGEAVFVKAGLSARWGRLVGLGVTLTAIVSSAVITIAFSGYVAALFPVPKVAVVLGILLVLATVAWLGVRESVVFAAVITVCEVVTLLVLGVVGGPMLADHAVWSRTLAVPESVPAWSAVLASSVIAFFAFVGFEDLVNMAEETVDPERTMPRAIVLTLLITVLLYVLIATIAVALPDRAALTSSSAPMALLFEQVTGLSGQPVAAMASIAMVNGILIQIVMASRVIYGMAQEGLVPPALGKVDARRRTPARATVLVVGLIAALALGFPLIHLAQVTSVVTLLVFTLVNLALWKLGGQPQAAMVLRRWRTWGLFGAILTVGMVLMEIGRMVL